MSYESRGGKMITRSIEFSAAYHCNLRCQGCSHMSPFVSCRFPSLDDFARDLAILSPVLHAGVIRLLGGEPLLNPELVPLLRAARDSGIADRVMVTTNGTRLHAVGEEFWDCVDLVLVSRYPGVSIRADLSECARTAQRFGAELWIDEVADFRVTLLTEVQPADWVTELIFRTCKDAHQDHCHMIHEGRLYKCAVPPFLPQYLEHLGESGYDPASDGLDLRAGRDMNRDLERFLLSPGVPEACRYCLGHLGVRQPCRQLAREELEDPRSLRIERNAYLDRPRLMRELLRGPQPPVDPAAAQGAG